MIETDLEKSVRLSTSVGYVDHNTSAKQIKVKHSWSLRKEIYQMKLILPVITTVIIFIVTLITDVPGLIAIAAVIPNSFVLGCIYDELKHKENN